MIYVKNPDYEGLIDAIERYIIKENDDLEDTLQAEGFVAADIAVEAINQIEDEATEVLENNAENLLDRLSEAEDIANFLADIWPEMQSEEQLTEALKEIFQKQFDDLMHQFTYNWLLSKDSTLAEAALEDGRLTKPAEDFISQWSTELAEMMQLSTNEQIEKILRKAKDNNLAIDEVTDLISDSGIRQPGYRARRVATTEVLRVESYAQLEGMRQDPLTYKKRWIHTGQQKGEPRANHVAISGQEVFKAEPFVLTGADGATYYPQCPRDTCLPASEAVNCHCIMEDIKNDTALGVSKEELLEMRQKAMDEVDAAWEERMKVEESLRYADSDTINNTLKLLREE